MDELTIDDVTAKMKQAIKVMKYVDTNAFRELITNEKFAEAIEMIDKAKKPESTEIKETESQETTEAKPKRKYTKKS